MSTVVSLCDYRTRQVQTAESDDLSGGASWGNSRARLARAQESLADASQALRGITDCLDEVARRLGHADPGVRERSQHRVRAALDKLHQCRVDTAELTRLIEAGDIDGCERLRASIQARREG